MDFFGTVGCRINQVISGVKKDIHPVRKQAVEEGAGSLFAVAQILRSKRVKKPLVVIGGDAARWSELLFRSLEENDIPYVVWGELPAHPGVQTGEDICLFWHRSECDCFVALGDATALNTAKLAALRAASAAKPLEALAGKTDIHNHRIPFLIAIPTVAGSSAESLAAIVLPQEGGTHLSIEGSALTPAFAVMDPDLTADTPRPVLAEAGMDGLCRAVEAYICPGYGNDESRLQAARAVKGFFAALEGCWNDGGTADQRAQLLNASRLAGLAASQTGYGYARALSLAAADRTGCGVGAACAAILPTVLEKYGTYVHERLAALAVLTEIKTKGTMAEKSSALIDYIRKIAFCVDLPEKMLGISDADAMQIAAAALADANPRCSCPVVWSADQLAEALVMVCGEV